MFTKHKTTNIINQKGCKSSNVLKFQPIVHIVSRTLEKKKQHMCVIRPHTINNNQNETLSKLAIYPNEHKLNYSKFLQVLLLDETLNGMSSNIMKIKKGMDQFVQ